MEKEFDVLVSRISHSSRTIRVTAESEEAAKEQALNKAGDYEFNEHDADYVADYVTPVITV